MPGSLMTDLPFEEPTLGLKVRLFTRPPGSVPFVKLDRSQQHQLVEEQRTGITAERARSAQRTAAASGVDGAANVGHAAIRSCRRARALAHPALMSSTREKMRR